MNTEQLARLLTALEQIAVGTGRIADALETEQARHDVPDEGVIAAFHARQTAPAPDTDLNPKGPYA